MDRKAEDYDSGSAMPAELPSINSTVSISDNIALTNYYDKLLFKNSSGKSLTDLPRRAAAAAAAAATMGDIYKRQGDESLSLGNVDFIDGFRKNYYDGNGLKHTISQNDDFHRRRSLFSSFDMAPSKSDPYPETPFDINQAAKNVSMFPSYGQFAPIDESSYAAAPPNYLSNLTRQTSSPNPMISPLNSAGTILADFQQPQANQQNNLWTARRSSYISDVLIHNKGPMSSPSSANNNIPKNMFNNKNMLLADNSFQPPNTSPPVAYYNNTAQNYAQRRNTQPLEPTSLPYSQNQRIMASQFVPRYGNGHSMSNNNNDLLHTETGLVAINDRQLTPSPDLRTLYKECGSKYFSSDLVYQFLDDLKNSIQHENNSAILQFVHFLKSCNLNYRQTTSSPPEKNKPQPNNKEDYQLKNDRRVGNRKNSVTSFSQYHPLVLVALKNGKLELLSIVQNSEYVMQRGDLVIIDGDRGKDLSLVVEPEVKLDLALLINFFKKKVHFDSLITSRKQHYPNNKFISALIESAKGESKKLDSKLYDVIELTQLVIPSKQVIRFATPWETTTNLHSKFQDELKALQIAKLKLNSLNSGLINCNTNGDTVENTTNGPQLNIKILNAEYQFDRKKLTFYYICEERNDFRALIKELFKLYKTRIWLCAIPNNLHIYSKYYESQKNELKMYQAMMYKYDDEDLVKMAVESKDGAIDSNNPEKNSMGFVVAPPLNKIELDNFQIGVYKELVSELFG